MNNSLPTAPNNLNLLGACARSAAYCILVAGAVLLAFAALTACGHATSQKPFHLYQGFDTSIGFRAHLPGSIAAGAELGARLDPDSDFLTLFRVDNRTQEFRSDRAPANEEQLQDQLVARLGVAATAKGTYPATFWREVSTQAASDSRCSAVGFWTDADNDDQGRAADIEIRNAARRLAANPRVAFVAICGADPAHWSKLREQFAPLGDRLILFVPENVDLNAIQQRIEVAKTMHAAAKGDN